MIVYFDTSALVKRYLVEEGSSAVEALWNRTTRAVASEILYDEMAATFARKKREVPADAETIEKARANFRAEWSLLDGFLRQRKQPGSLPPQGQFRRW